MVPPPYLGQTFAGDHEHYLTTCSTVLDALDVENMIHHVTEHGYGLANGSQLVLIVNPLDSDASAISAWKAGVEYRTGAPLPTYDFIPSALMPAWISKRPCMVRSPTPSTTACRCGAPTTTPSSSSRTKSRRATRSWSRPVARTTRPTRSASASTLHLNIAGLGISPATARTPSRTASKFAGSASAPGNGAQRSSPRSRPISPTPRRRLRPSRWPSTHARPSPGATRRHLPHPSGGPPTRTYSPANRPTTKAQSFPGGRGRSPRTSTAGHRPRAACTCPGRHAWIHRRAASVGPGSTADRAARHAATPASRSPGRSVQGWPRACRYVQTSAHERRTPSRPGRVREPYCHPVTARDRLPAPK